MSRHNRKMLLRLAENRHKRIGPNGRPVFDLTPEEIIASTKAAMRVAKAGAKPE